MILITMPVIGLPVPVRGRAPAAVPFPAAVEVAIAAAVRIEVPGLGAVAMVCVSKISSARGKGMCVILGIIYENAFSCAADMQGCFGAFFHSWKHAEEYDRKYSEQEERVIIII